MELELKGKVAVITGATDGIGRAAALMLAHEGAKVAICSRRAEAVAKTLEEIQRAGGDAFGMAADMSKAADIERFIGAATRHFGRLDILVNNAGTSKRGAFLELDDAAWSADLELKVFGAIR